MNTEMNSYAYQMPSYEQEGISFAEKKRDLEVFQELNQISEEIEKCRLRNC